MRWKITISKTQRVKMMNDNERMNRIAAMPCVCCEIEGISQPNRTTVHHIVDNGYRRLSGGHQSTIPLCEWHHQGYPVQGALGLTVGEMENVYGPSLAHKKRAFNAEYGGERKLLEIINKRLEVL